MNIFIIHLLLVLINVLEIVIILITYMLKYRKKYGCNVSITIVSENVDETKLYVIQSKLINQDKC